MEYGFLGVILCALSKELFFTLCAGALFAGFTVCLFVSIFRSGYGIKKRTWFLIVLLAMCALLKARANISGEKDVSPILSTLGLILYLPLFFIREKKVKDKRGADENAENAARRDFVRFLDERIHNAGAPETNARASFSEENGATRPEVLKAQEKQEQVFDEPDFSHVKNVLQRLEPASLSYADRRQIHELELALYEAENGEYSENTKGKINEGLGNLLKIMARHGV